MILVFLGFHNQRCPWSFLPLLFTSTLFPVLFLSASISSHPTPYTLPVTSNYRGSEGHFKPESTHLMIKI